MTKQLAFSIESIPLSKLCFHPQNVRKINPDEAAMISLVSNIKEMGLLQSISVQKLKDGSFGVIAGGRRLAALQTLADDKDATGFSKGMKIPCRVFNSTADITSISLSENFTQLPMGAIDRFEAFTDLSEREKLTPEQIAHRFGVEKRLVLETLRFGLIHPQIRDAHRAGDINLEALKSFATHPDQNRQIEVFANLKDAWNGYEPYRIRSALEENGLRLGSPLAQIILDQYRAANGPILPDLIEEDSILTDEDLINRLKMELLIEAAEQHRKENGFVWSEVLEEYTYGYFFEFGRVYPEEIELDEKTSTRLEDLQTQFEEANSEYEGAVAGSEEEQTAKERISEINALINNIQTEAYTTEDLKRSGVVAYWNNNKICFQEGLVKPEDKSQDNTIDDEKGIEATDEGSQDSKYSQKLATDLQHDRTRVLQLQLAQNPIVARNYMDFVVVNRMLSDAYYFESGTEITLSYGNNTPTERKGKDGILDEINTQIDALKDQLPMGWYDSEKSEAENFEAYSSLDMEDQDTLISFAVAMTLTPKFAASEVKTARDVMEEVVMPDLRDTIWVPDFTLFSRLTKGQLITILHTDLGMKDEAFNFGSAKKSEIVTYLNDLFAAPFATLTEDQLTAVTRWTPDKMQTGARCEDIDDEDDTASSELDAAA